MSFIQILFCELLKIRKYLLKLMWGIMTKVSTIYNIIVDILLMDKATTEQEKHVLNVCILILALIYSYWYNL